MKSRAYNNIVIMRKRQWSLFKASLSFLFGYKIFFGPVSSGLEVELNAKANKYDEEVAETMVKLFGAQDFAKVMEDYEVYLDKNGE